MYLQWQLPRRRLDLSREGLIMGILNVTPDSFSDGGRYPSAEAAAARALEMEAEGAGIIDIGGESTRPGSDPVPVDEQLRRVLPVVKALRQHSDVLISIDTTRAAVAQAALEAGADIINDISALRDDPEMGSVCAAMRAGVVLMHMQGTPRTMQQAPFYHDVTTEVRDFLAERLGAAEAAGVEHAALIVDPGIGFGKTAAHNLQILRELDRANPNPARPLLLGVSRKRFIGHVVGSDALAHRTAATTALTAYGREKGARLFRVHDVLPNVHAIKIAEAILSAGGTPE